MLSVGLKVWRLIHCDCHVYSRTLGFYCELNKTDLKQFLGLLRLSFSGTTFTDFIRRLERGGKASSYLLRFKLKVNIRGKSDTPRIADERVPNKEELNRILRIATPNGRVSIALMWLSMD